MLDTKLSEAFDHQAQKLYLPRIRHCNRIFKWAQICTARFPIQAMSANDYCNCMLKLILEITFTK